MSERTMSVILSPAEVRAGLKLVLADPVWSSLPPVKEVCEELQAGSNGILKARQHEIKGLKCLDMDAFAAGYPDALITKGSSGIRVECDPITRQRHVEALQPCPAACLCYTPHQWHTFKRDSGDDAVKETQCKLCGVMQEDVMKMYNQVKSDPSLHWMQRVNMIGLENNEMKY